MARPKFIFTDKDADYLMKNYKTETYGAISMAIGCHVDTLRRLVYKMGLRKEPILNQTYGDIMEDYFGRILPMTEIARVRELPYGKVNQIIRKGFKLRESENTKTITLKSKV